MKKKASVEGPSSEVNFEQTLITITRYRGNQAAAVCAGMEVLNRAIESIMNSTDRDEWEPSVVHVSDNVLSVWRGQVSSSSRRVPVRHASPHSPL